MQKDSERFRLCMLMDSMTVTSENEIIEQDKINAANLYRRPSHETLYKEIKQKESFYEYLVSQGQRPELNKRDYVGQALGISDCKNEGDTIIIPKKIENGSLEGVDTTLQQLLEILNYSSFLFPF